MASILLDNVSLTFRIRQQFQITFKEYLLKRMFRQVDNPLTAVRALRQLDLHIGDGERVGIIGANGSGKSTLLRLLANIYYPTSGRCQIQGKVSSLLELTLGFEMEANGWKNIVYRGYLQGETPRSIRAKMSNIAEFCELGKFLDIPVRYYSAGMLVRLAFSIATAIEPEILLIDEVLCAGDLAFQAKALQRMRDMMNRARILVMVSHDLGLLPQLCQRGIWLHQGRIQRDGPIAEVIAAYVQHAQEAQLAFCEAR